MYDFSEEYRSGGSFTAVKWHQRHFCSNSPGRLLLSTKQKHLEVFKVTAQKVKHEKCEPLLNGQVHARAMGELFHTTNLLNTLAYRNSFSVLDA